MKKSHVSAFAFFLAGAVVPSVLVGILSVSAASADMRNEYKDTSFQLFDAEEFRVLRRKSYQEEVKPPAAPTKKAAPAVNPCDESETETEEASAERPLYLEDLDLRDRETLRMQLRIGGCPEGVLPGYKALCESMLKAQGAKESLKGLVNPYQE